MAEVTVTLCDVCMKLGRETTRYTITGGGMSVSADLCDQDAAPLEKIRAAAEGDAAASAPRPSPTPRKPHARKLPRDSRKVIGGARVATMDEIEAMKRKQAASNS